MGEGVGARAMLEDAEDFVVDLPLGVVGWTPAFGFLDDEECGWERGLIAGGGFAARHVVGGFGGGGFVGWWLVVVCFVVEFEAEGNCW